jgi:hypothetical protein
MSTTHKDEHETAQAEQAKFDSRASKKVAKEAEEPLCELCKQPEDPGAVGEDKMTAVAGRTLHPRCRQEFVRRSKEKADEAKALADVGAAAPAVPAVSSNR